MVAHWVRRHRAVALSVALAVLVATTGVAVSVRNIAVERDRAEAANNGRILEHAELLLHTDPTAAVAALSEYRGDDALRRRRLLAEAHGRGVARAVVAPHSDTVWLAIGDETGAIVSLGEDRKIQLTRGPTTTTLASDVSPAVRVAYAPARRLVAYATSPAGIAVLDLRTRTIRRITTFDPAVIELAPDGARLAALGGHGELAVWSTGADPTPIHRETIPGAIGLRFATPTRLVVQDAAGLRAVALDTTGGSPDAIALADVTAFDALPDAVVAGTAGGDIVMVSPSLAVLGRTSMCHQQLRDVRLIPHSDRLAFSCQAGITGIARRDRVQHGLHVVDTFATRGLTWITADVAGRYVVVMDESRTAYVYDAETRLLTHYDGNAGQPSHVAAPTPAFDHVLIGDANGTVRVWDAPPRAARVVLQAADAILGLAFAPDGKALVTGGVDKVARRVALGDGEATVLAGPRSVVLGVHASPDGRTALGVNYDGTVRVWRTSDGALLRSFAGHGSVVADADYVEGGRRIVSVGDDGRLLAWSPDGTDASVLVTHTAPLIALEVLARNDHVVIADAAGALWDAALDGTIRKVRGADGGALTMLRAAPDGRYLATGTGAGVVTVYETSSWQVVKTIEVAGGVRQIAFDPMDRDLVIGSEAGHAQFGRVQLVALGVPRAPGWHDVPAPVRDVAYAPDGDTIGFVCADGGTWLYAIGRDTWAYTRDHDIDTLVGRFSPDGRLFATADGRGVVVVRDVAATLATAVN